MKGDWVRYSYARARGKEYLVVFNIYGGAVALEVLHILKDGRARSIFFIGSMYGKHLPIGALVIPTLAIDRAGLVLVDDQRAGRVTQDSANVAAIELALKAVPLSYHLAKIVSVPCVLHDLQSVKRFIAETKDVMGVEMEVSTFLHFSKKIGLEGYALLYVSDNPRHGIISGAQSVWVARRKALRRTTEVALSVLGF